MAPPPVDDRWFAVCVLAVVSVAVIDLSTGDASNLTGSLSFVPFLASATCSRRRTLIVSALTLAVGITLLVINMVPASSAVVRSLALLGACVLGPIVAAGRARRDRQMAELIHVAEVAQLAVLTPVPPLVGPVALSSAYRSASREALIGGDLYAVVERPPGVRILVGDVRGKGLDAVQMAALVLSVFRETAVTRASLVECAAALDLRIQPFLKIEDFVTAVFADVHEDGAVTVVTCGHPPPIVVDAQQQRLLDIAQPAAPLGLDPTPRAVHVRLNAGDRMLFYTDGLVEARGRNGGFVDLDALLATLPTDPTDVALARVLDRLQAAAGDVRDDLALLLVEYVGAPVAVPAGQPASSATT